MRHRSTSAHRFTVFIVAALLLIAAGRALGARQVAPGVGAEEPSLELTLERMVELALNNSYRIRHLNLSIDRTRLRLQASRARLRSRVDLEFSIPSINYISEARWDPDLQRSVIQRENSRRLQADLSIRQPVILFGYPTNGYISLNSRLYQLRQVDGDASDLRYYNRYFIRYTQPLFEANELRNDLERAELDLEAEELEYYGDIVEIIDNATDDYFELFEIAYQRRVRQAYVDRLDEALVLAEAAVAGDADRSIDVDQIRIELANAREDVAASERQLRLETSRLRTQFGIPSERVISIDPRIELSPVPIDEEQATRFALQLTPRLRRLGIDLRRSEIDLDNVRGRGGFRMDVSLSYGREMQDEVFRDIWEQPENSYTVDVTGSVPIWDWGEREARIQAEMIDVERERLEIEEANEEIRAGVRNEVRNIAEYEDRAFTMEETMSLSRSVAAASLERYETGRISALDLLQSLRRERDTAENFLDAYLGWRRALQRIQELTYFDWEYGMPLLDRFGISFGEEEG